MARAMLPVDAELRRKARKALARHGYTLKEAVEMFLRRVVEEREIPLDLRTPSPATRAALDELDRGKGKRFSDPDELFRDLRA